MRARVFLGMRIARTPTTKVISIEPRPGIVPIIWIFEIGSSGNDAMIAPNALVITNALMFNKVMLNMPTFNFVFFILLFPFVFQNGSRSRTAHGVRGGNGYLLASANRCRLNRGCISGRTQLK